MRFLIALFNIMFLPIMFLFLSFCVSIGLNVHSPSGDVLDTEYNYEKIYSTKQNTKEYEAVLEKVRFIEEQSEFDLFKDIVKRGSPFHNRIKTHFSDHEFHRDASITKTKKGEIALKHKNLKIIDANKEFYNYLNRYYEDKRYKFPEKHTLLIVNEINEKEDYTGISEFSDVTRGEGVDDKVFYIFVNDDNNKEKIFDRIPESKLIN